MSTEPLGGQTDRFQRIMTTVKQLGGSYNPARTGLGRILDALQSLFSRFFGAERRIKLSSTIFSVPRENWKAFKECAKENAPDLLPISIKKLFANLTQGQKTFIPLLHFENRFKLTVPEEYKGKGRITNETKEAFLNALVKCNFVGIPLNTPADASELERQFVTAYNEKRIAYAAFLDTQNTG